MTIYAQLVSEPSKWEPIRFDYMDIRKHTGSYFKESIFRKGLITISASDIKASDLIAGLKGAGVFVVEDVKDAVEGI